MAILISAELVDRQHCPSSREARAAIICDAWALPGLQVSPGVSGRSESCSGAEVQCTSAHADSHAMDFIEHLGMQIHDVVPDRDAATNFLARFHVVQTTSSVKNRLEVTTTDQRIEVPV